MITQVIIPCSVIQMRASETILLLLLVLATIFCTCGEKFAAEPPAIVSYGVFNPKDGSYDVNGKFYFQEDASVELFCTATGTPAPTCRWRKITSDDQEDSRTRTIMGCNKTLTNMQYSDEGTYQCLAINEYGTTLSDMIHFKLLKFPRHRKRIPRTIFTWLGKYVALTCITSSLPTSQYSWKEVDRVKVKENRFTQDENGKLHIRNVQSIDIGHDYNCEVENRIGNATQSISGNNHYSIKLNGDVHTIPDSKPVLVEYSDKVSVVTVGSPFSLICIYNGNPTPDTTWVLPRGLSSVQVVFSYSNTILKIPKVQQEHEGDYMCTGKNYLGEQHITFSVEVKSAPVFEETPVDVTTLEGESVTYSCKTQANPAVEKENVQWSINRTPIEILDMKDYEMTEDRLNLTFRDVCKVNCGPGKRPVGDLLVVQCNASNVHGYAFSSVYLNVLERTTWSVHRPFKGMNIAPPYVFNLSCGAHFDPSTAARNGISWWKESQRINGGDWRLIVQEANSSYSTLHFNLTATTAWEKENYSGNYTCKASNNHEQASALSEIVWTTTLYVPPTLSETRKREMNGTISLTGIYVLLVLILLLLLIVIIRICLPKGKKVMTNRPERKSQARNEAEPTSLSGNRNDATETNGDPDGNGTNRTTSL